MKTKKVKNSNLVDQDRKLLLENCYFTLYLHKKNVSKRDVRAVLKG